MNFFFKKLRQKKSKDVQETKESSSNTIKPDDSKVEPSTDLLNLKEQKLLFQAAYGGQCGICTFAKLVSTSKDSHFIMCSHPQLPKYQGQPVFNCNFVDFREETPTTS